MSQIKSIFYTKNRLRKPLILLAFFSVVILISCNFNGNTQENQTVTENVLKNPQEDGFEKQNNKIEIKEKVHSQSIDLQIDNSVIFVEFADGEPTIEIDNFIYRENIPLSEEIQRFTFEESEKYQIADTLVYAIMQVESNFDENVYSVTNDSGLMQLNKNTIPWLKNQIEMENNFDPFNPKHNIKAGVWYLNWLREYWIEKGYTSEEDLFHIVTTSYNMGHNRVRQRLSEGKLTSTYSNKVLDAKIQIEMGEQNE